MCIWWVCQGERESFYTQVIIKVNILPNHIDTRTNLLRYESSWKNANPSGSENKNTIKYHTLLVSKKNHDILIKIPNGKKQHDDGPTLVNFPSASLNVHAEESVSMSYQRWS